MFKRKNLIITSPSLLVYIEIGCDLKENQKFGKKGDVKHMPDKVIELLKPFFMQVIHINKCLKN